MELLTQDKLKPALVAMPEIPLKPTRPYFLANINVKQRTELLKQHYGYFVEHYNDLLPKLFSKEGLFIGKLPGEGNNHITLKCDYFIRREAELALSITDGNNRLYSIGFNILKYKDTDEYAIFISNLQGPTPEDNQYQKVDMQQVTKQLTKQCFGYQPRFFLINLCCYLGKAMGFNHIFAIHTESHVFQCVKYRDRLGAQIFLDYDALWENYTPEPFDKNFVEIHAEPQKTMEEISSNKRSMYRKRYAWCDELVTGLNNIFAQK